MTEIIVRDKRRYKPAMDARVRPGHSGLFPNESISYVGPPFVVHQYYTTYKYCGPHSCPGHFFREGQDEEPHCTPKST